MRKSNDTTIKRTLDLGKPPVLGAAQKARLKALADMPDDQIDYSDAPHLANAAWTRVADLPGTKRQVTLRIDADVLDYFKLTGKRYQTRINAVLRSYVQAHKTPA
jgi:uncharacterized protein (DUF4415 family)